MNLKKEIYGFLIVFFFSVLIYGFYIFNSTLNIDGEFVDNFYQTLALGRWFHAILRKYILPEPFMVVFTPLAAVFILTLSSVIVCRIFSLKGKDAYIASMLFMSFPQFSYQLEFLNQADTFAIAILMCSLSAYFVIYRGWCTFFISCLLLVSAIGIYQTAISFYWIVCFGYIYIQFCFSCNKYGLIKIISKVLFSTLISACLYIFVSLWFKNHYGINSGTYINNYIYIGTGREYILSVLKGWFKFVLGVKYTGEVGYAILFIGILSIIVKKDLKNKYKIIFGGVIITSIPAFLILISGGGVPARVFVGSAAALLITFVVLSTVYTGKFFRVIVCGVILLNSVFVNYLFFKDYAVRQQDLKDAHLLISYMHDHKVACEFDSVIYIHGASHKNNLLGSKSDTFGQSFFSWDNGNYLRIAAFFRYYNLCSAQPAKENEVRKVMPYIENMPSWPEEGSIKKIENVIVIKLSDVKGWLPFSIE